MDLSLVIYVRIFMIIWVSYKKHTLSVFSIHLYQVVFLCLIPLKQQITTILAYMKIQLSSIKVVIQNGKHLNQCTHNKWLYLFLGVSVCVCCLCADRYTQVFMGARGGPQMVWSWSYRHLWAAQPGCWASVLSSAEPSCKCQLPFFSQKLFWEKLISF